MWLTYDEESDKAFCSVCLAFAKSTNPSIFISGMQDWRHIHDRVKEHEQGMSHRNCAEAYFFQASKANIKNVLCGKQMSAHRDQVRKKRQVLERIVDVVKLIGKRGLAYRGAKNEAAYTLEDSTIDHGNFLELILLLGKYDVIMKEHLTNCIEQSKDHHHSGAKGRGSLVTLISKTTVKYVIDTVKQLIQESISSDVQGAGMFSVQIDTTQDITAQDQCSVILRYVTDVIHERLVAVVKCEQSTGQYFVDMLTEVLDQLKIDMTKCIGSSTDGASNMQGQYKGFSTLLSSKSPNSIHVWCYAHVLNLVMADTTQTTIECGSLFALLNDIAVFIRESYKRMNVWENESQDRRHRRLSPIGETRWWAKHEALKKVFGFFAKPESGLFVDVLLTLAVIQEQATMKTTVRVKARGYMEALLRHETILTAQVFLRIFEETTVLSKYLQTKGMDILQAYRMVEATQGKLEAFKTDYKTVKAAADNFVRWANEKLQEQEGIELEVQAALPEKRQRKKKVLPGETAQPQDETLLNAERAYEKNVHNKVMNTAVETMERRFQAHGTLFADLSILDPRHFSAINKSGLPPSALQELSKCLVKLDDRATVENLQSELKSLAGHWDRLKASPLDEYVNRTVEVEDGSDEDQELVEIVNRQYTSCQDCPLCCYQLLRKLNLLSDTYHMLGLAYKFLLTLSITQVACERSFSTLKFIKSRLRSSLSQKHLEAFMLMATEKDVLMTLDTDAVIDRVAEKSALLTKMLI